MTKVYTREEIFQESNILDQNITQNKLKIFVRFLLNYLKVNIRYSITPGISFFGINLFYDCRKGQHKFRSDYALDYIKKLNLKTVLDVGSGGGYHASEFKLNGAEVTCVDYGTSIYATESKIEKLNVITIDFNKFNLFFLKTLLSSTEHIYSITRVLIPFLITLF